MATTANGFTPLSDLYLSKSGGTVNGNMSVTGTQTVQNINITNGVTLGAPDNMKNAIGLNKVSFTPTAYTTGQDVTVYNNASKHIPGLGLTQLAFHVTWTPSESVAAGTRVQIATIPAEYAPSQLTAITVTYYYTLTSTVVYSGVVDTSGNVYIRCNSDRKAQAYPYIKLHGMWMK